jgi:hypothetical protein
MLNGIEPGIIKMAWSAACYSVSVGNFVNEENPFFLSHGSIYDILNPIGIEIVTVPVLKLI